MVDSMREKTVQIDQAGRVVLPKLVRDRFHLRGGDTLAIAVRRDTIELRPASATGQLKRVNGMLVFTGPIPIASGDDFVAQARDERMDNLLREAKAER
jgi:AbrB family looped-hinge helix DNA binding protein